MGAYAAAGGAEHRAGADRLCGPQCPGGLSLCAGRQDAHSEQQRHVVSARQPAVCRHPATASGHRERRADVAGHLHQQERAYPGTDAHCPR